MELHFHLILFGLILIQQILSKFDSNVCTNETDRIFEETENFSVSTVNIRLFEKATNQPTGHHTVIRL